MKKSKLLWLALILALVMSVSAITAFAAGEPTLTVKTTSLELENAVYMNFKVQSKNISDTSSVKLLVWESYPGKYTKGTEDAELSVMKTEAGTGYLVFQYTDLAAKDMTKFVYVCAYANINGKEYYSNATKFSIVQYAYNAQSDAKLKPLVDNMLAYGASAQTYFNYKTDFLATDPIVKVRVEGGTHADGFKTMYYQKGSMSTFIAGAPAEGMEFSHWKNSAGAIVGTSATLSIPMNADDTYTAVYRDKNAQILLFKLSEDESYYIVSGLDESCTETEIIIPDTYNGKPVKAIAVSAFSGCKNITDVIIPDSVKSIGVSAFRDCANLTSITIPMGVTEIANWTFYGCTSLTDITIPRSVMSIGQYAFSDCTSLETIKLPNTVTAIGPYAFRNCVNLANITLPTNITTIESYLFKGCRNLKTVKIPVGVTTIGDKAFLDCTNLSNITIPNGVTAIGDSAFYSCSSLEFITIPDSVKSIGAFAFYGCKNLTKFIFDGTETAWNKVTLGEDWNRFVPAEITFTKFDYTKDLYFALSADETYYIVTGLAEGCTDTHIIIPATYNGLPVKEIREKAFYSRENLEKVDIPDSVTYIGVGAFKYCTALSEIHMSKNVGYVDIEAFHGTAYYNNPENWENGALYIENCLYAVNESIETITVKDGTTIIASYAFGKESKLKEIYFPNSLTIINPLDFTTTHDLLAIHVNDDHPTFMVKNGDLYSKDGSVLLQYAIGKTDESFVVPSHVTFIEESAFEEAAFLKSVTISEGVIEIGEFAFYRCSNLKSVDLPNTLIGIDQGAFVFCESLENVNLPDGLQYIGASAFGGCTSLKSIDIPESVTEIRAAAFAECTSLERVTIPEGVTIIDEAVFGACKNLKVVVIPNGVERIESLAFAYCDSLEYIVIPKTLTHIAEGAFTESNRLKYVCYDGTLYDFNFTADGEGNESFFNAQFHCYYGETGPVDEFNFWWHYNKDGEIEIWSHLYYRLSEDGTYYSVAGVYNYYNETEIVIPSMYEGLPVKAINPFAFEDNTTITSVVIPESVTEIGRYAFSGCTALEKIVMPENVTFVGSRAFHNTAYYNNAENWENGVLYIDHCLYAVDETVTILGVKKGTTLMADYALFTDNLKEVSFPNSLESLGNQNYGKGLTAIYVKDSHPTAMSVDGILYSKDGTQLFCYPAGRSEESFIVPNGVTQICDYAFQYANALKSVTLPEGLTDIGMEAFFYCENIVSVNLPESLKTIGEAAFYRCVSLESIETFPKGLQSIGAEAFGKCISLKTLILPGASTEIGEMAFAYCQGLTSVTIPEGHKYIGYGWLGACSSLTSVVVPNGVERIDDAAFALCESLTKIIIPNSVTLISEAVFNESDNLKTVYFHGTEAQWKAIKILDENEPLKKATVYYYSETQPTTEGNFWCYDAKGNATIWKPVEVDSTNELIFTLSEDKAYYIVSGLKADSTATAIVIPSAYEGLPVTKIGEKAFMDTKIVSITVPEGVVAIGDYAFAGCKSLSKVNLPKTLTDMGYYTFQNATMLKTISIPSGVTSIYPYTFSGCTGLARVTIVNGVTNIHSFAFYGCKSLSSISIPSTVTNIMGFAFYGCTSLKTITLPNGLTAINPGVFQNCAKLASIIIPSGVKTIDENAFLSCSALGQIFFKGTETAWNQISIHESNDTLETATVYYYSETQPTIQGNFWYYDAKGSAVIWEPYEEPANPDLIFELSEDATYYIVGGIKEDSTATEIVIPATYQGKPVKAIRMWAFSYRENIESVMIPDGVTTIGESAFNGCKNLKSVVIPDSVTDVGRFAFYQCQSLQGIELPKNLTSIGNAAFGNCTSLTSIVIPDNITCIDQEFFYNCTSLESVTLPKNLTKIDSWAFGFCTSLVNIDIPSGVTYIGDNAFYQCSSLTSITIPDGVTNILNETFARCESLTSIVIPDSVTSIGDYVFELCKSLKSVFYKGTKAEWNLIKIGEWNDGLGSAIVYYYSETQPTTEGNFWCYDSKGNTAIWKPVEVDSTNELIFTLSEDKAYYIVSGLKADSTATAIVIPSAYEGLPVTKIGEKAFMDTKIVSITVPEGVVAIGDYAFAGCKSLSKVNLPKTLTDMGYYTFQNATTLKTISIPSGVTDIYPYTFSGCAGLTRVTIVNGVTNIHSFAFEGCKRLTGVSIPSTVKNIMGFAFYGCASLKTITLPNGLTEINPGVFQNCAKLASIIIPSGVKTIGENAFLNCSALNQIFFKGTETDWNQISIHESNDTLETATVYYYSETQPTTQGNFWYYDAKSGAVIWEPYEEPANPDLIFGLSEDATYYIVRGLKEGSTATEIVIPATYQGKPVKAIDDGAFYGCTPLESVVISKGVTSIGVNAFRGCTNLESILIPDSVTNIGSYAFYECKSLDGVELPKGLMSIENGAFGYCTSLTSIRIPNGITDINKYTFDGCASLESVWIPNSVTTIDNWAFANCASLVSIDIPADVTYIGEATFFQCLSLTSIIIPDGVTNILHDTFAGCENLASIVIPNSVTSIDKVAFWGCNSMESVFYKGTEIEWNQITIYENNYGLKVATIYYYSETQPTTEGNFWYYDAKGGIVIWG